MKRKNPFCTILSLRIDQLALHFKYTLRSMETSNPLDLWMYFAFLVLVTSVVILMNYGGNYPASFPPGPRGWPIVGNLLQVARGDGLYDNLLKFRQEYGDVFRVQLGQQTWVFIGGHKAITETLLNKKTSIAGRPNWLYTVKTLLQGRGIIWSNGILNEKARSFVLETYNEAKGHLEKSILANCEDIISSIDRDDPESLSQKLKEAEFITVLNLIIGERLCTSSDKYQRLRQLYDARNEGMTIGSPQNSFSWLNTFYRGKTNAALEAQRTLIKDLEGLLMTRMEQDDHGSECLINHYAKQLTQEKLQDVDKEHFFLTMIDLVLASNDSLLVMVQWTLLNLANHSEVQKKCRQELLKVAVKRRVSISDRENSPYFSSVIRESMRKNTHVPLSLPYYFDEDVKVNDYIIPKETVIFFMYETILSDDKLWTCPAQLQPERFSLTESSDVDNKKANFGLGSRYCPGRALSEMFQYLVVSSIIMEYEVENLSEDKSMDGYFKSVLRPKTFNLRFNKILS